jgi:hypothetical protein
MGHWLTNTQFTCTVDCGYTTHTIPHSHYKSFLIVVLLNCNEVQQIWIEIFLFSDVTSLKFVPNGFHLTLRVLVVNPPPTVDNWILSKCSKKCPNRVSPHFPLFRHTLQYKLFKYPHLTHASWHWTMYSLSIFWNKKTHVSNCQTKI